MMLEKEGDWGNVLTTSRNNSQKSSIKFNSVLLNLKPGNLYTLLHTNTDTLLCSGSLAKRGQLVAEEKARITKTSLLLQNMHPRTFTGALRPITINN